MTLQIKPPFFIGARLAPALKVGDATLSYLEGGWAPREKGFENFVPRQYAVMALDFSDGTSYEDDRLQSGLGGFSGIVAMFESFLSFLEAAAESYDYEQRTGREGENTSLFPAEVVKWAAGCINEVGFARLELQKDDAGAPRNELILETA